jgi:hypothetical protein
MKHYRRSVCTCVLLWLPEHVRTTLLSIGKAADMPRLTISSLLTTIAAHGSPLPNYPAENHSREFGLAG